MFLIKGVLTILAFINNSFYNDYLIPINSFNEYIDYYISDKDFEESYEVPNNRWEIAACLSPEQTFEQVSFVNGINTIKGGKHIDYISYLI